MFVNISFMGDDPLENIITCLNFNIEKIIYLGFQKTIRKNKQSVESFLRSFCSAKSTAFYQLPGEDIRAIVNRLEQIIKEETAAGNKLFFDITAGEPLLLMAFGMLAGKYDVPVHMYDVRKNRLILVTDNETENIKSMVPCAERKLDIRSYIKLMGGTINYRMHKSSKDINSDEFRKDIEAMWRVQISNPAQWNPFSGFLNSYMIPDEDLRVNIKESKVTDALKNTRNKLRAKKHLDEMLDQLADAGVLPDYSRKEGRYCFRYKNNNIKRCLFEGGSLLELHVYLEEQKEADDCMTGVHLDWDGIISNNRRDDVVNEIDVMSVRNNIPVFISCKSGRMDSGTVLHALYELESVTSRFGGRYGKKVLAVIDKVDDIYLERAANMGIEVRRIR